MLTQEVGVSAEPLFPRLEAGGEGALWLILFSGNGLGWVPVTWSLGAMRPNTLIIW